MTQFRMSVVNMVRRNWMNAKEKVLKVHPMAFTMKVDGRWRVLIPEMKGHLDQIIGEGNCARVAWEDAYNRMIGKTK